jgi:hypothetical protein
VSLTRPNSQLFNIPRYYSNSFVYQSSFLFILGRACCMIIIMFRLCRSLFGRTSCWRSAPVAAPSSDHRAPDRAAVLLWNSLQDAMFLNNNCFYKKYPNNLYLMKTAYCSHNWAMQRFTITKYINATANRDVCCKSITFIMVVVGGLNMCVCWHFNCAALHILITKILSFTVTLSLYNNTVQH